MFTLAFLSDPHIAPLPKPTIGELASKRLFGYINWQLSRKAVHDRSILDAITADLLAQKTDHIAVGGDLINLALPGEFGPALDWLKSLGAPEHVSVVPGNHDAYVVSDHRTGTGLWSNYMCSDVSQLQKQAPGPDSFPYVRRMGRIALIGLSSAVPKPPFFASGRLGATQISALRSSLSDLKKDDLFRVVMVHHPPLPGLSSKRRGLDDVKELEAVLLENGAELVLYGHRHIHAIDTLASTPPAPVIGAPSASSADAKPGHLARYYLFRIWQSEKHWNCEMIARGLETIDGPIAELERRMIIG